ncbi:hypothetical protein JHK87_039234 [Glycine soja]|nr:hypothetical protein JHK87_039234 [Glycine soja]
MATEDANMYVSSSILHYVLSNLLLDLQQLQDLDTQGETGSSKFHKLVKTASTDGLQGSCGQNKKLNKGGIRAGKVSVVGNCMFTASQKAMSGKDIYPREL